MVHLVGFYYKNKASPSAQIGIVREIFTLVFERLHKFISK